MDTIINVNHLSKCYMIYDNPVDRLKETLGITRKKTGKQFMALNDVSFSVEKGKTLGIIGENGAGKSTLLKILTGVLMPTSGTISLNGKVSALLELGTGFNPEYTGLENIYLSGNVMGLTQQEISSKVPDIIQFADIGDFIDQKVKTYSSGMFARLAFAVAVHVEPEILIVDEALAVGDLFFQQKCNLYMKEHMKNCTKLLVTHDMTTIANMADTAIVLNKGCKVFEGEPLKAIEFYTKQAHTELFQGTNRNQNIPELKISEKEWNYISKDSLGGALESEIKAYQLSINGSEYCGYVQRGDKISISLIVESQKFIKNLIIGYQVKDKYGNIIFGENTHSSGFSEQEIEPFRAYILEFSFIWPKIQENTYFITLGLGEGTHEMQHIIQCWAHNVIELSAISFEPNHGLFNNKIQEFTVKGVL